MTFFDIKNALSSRISELKQPILPKQKSNVLIPQQKDERDNTFDILKGIAIIFMIIGHCDDVYLHAFIFSFHMPIFFFITGYFLKKRPLRDEFRLSIKRLFIPYIFTSACICIVAICKDLFDYTWTDGSYSQGMIIKFLLGFKGETAPNWIIGHIGILWFILAMFWARCIVVFFINSIKSVKRLCFLFLFLGITGIILEKHFFVPYCIPQGLSAAGFIYTGVLVQKFKILHNLNIKQILPFFLILWLYTLSQGGLDMADCFFPTGYVFGLFGSLGFFIILHRLCTNFCCKYSFFGKILLFSGHYSLIIYCIHAIEKEHINWRAFALLHHLPLEHFEFFQISIRLAIAFIFTLIVIKIKPLRENIFQIK